MLYGIKAFEFDARVRRAELPVHRANLLVAMILPALNLPTEVLDSGDIVGQALPCQDTQFDLGNIEPTRMLGGVVDFQAVDEGFCLLRRKYLVERSGRVRVKLSRGVTSLTRLQNEVGHRRGAFRPFSVAPFPNDTGRFPCMSLSRGNTP